MEDMNPLQLAALQEQFLLHWMSQPSAPAMAAPTRPSDNTAPPPVNTLRHAADAY